ncbi:Nucleolar protein 12-like protein [Drosera capensis]
MAKKPQSPENQSPNNAVNPNPKPSSIFDQLFGHTPQIEPSSSLFSSHNPFRRKPQPQTPKQAPESHSGSEPYPVSHSQIPKDADLSKRKRNKEKRNGFDGESEGGFTGEVLKGKKSKREMAKEAEMGTEKGKVVELGSEKAVGGNPVLEMIGNDGEKVKKGKEKKRKRDELEREYEERKFGVMAEEEKEEKVVGRKRKTVENPEEMKVTKDGYDDEEKLLRTVFVGNLPLKVKKKVLLKEFSQFGEVESMRIRSVPTLDIKKPKKVQITLNQVNETVDSVHAYVVFKIQDSAEASLAHNMAVFGGNHIRVDRACPPRKKLKGDSAPLYDTKRTLFLGNLPFDVKDEEVYRLFNGISQQESSVEAVRIIRDSRTSAGKGIAYVLFNSREAANMFARRKNLKLRDRELRVSHAKAAAAPPTKRKYSALGETENTPSNRSTMTWKFPENDYKKQKSKVDTSYQGLRASKSGSEKKAPSSMMRPMNTHSGAGTRERMKQRRDKRPAVAARKAKALRAGGGKSNQGDRKRKMDSRTPQSLQQKKKLKKSK